MPPTPCKPPCWPDDPDYLDGYTKIDLPPERHLRAHWDVDILDPDEEPPHRIINAGDSFKVRFRVALTGSLWSCICGSWWFDLGFTPIGGGEGFDLSTLVGKDQFWVKDWKGCETRCIELCVTVPPNTIPVGYCGTLYDCGGRFQMYCCEEPAPIAGYEFLKQYEFYRSAL